MSDASRRPGAGLDTSVPNIARMNNYFLGGKDNFAADRRAAEEVLAIAPEVREMTHEAQAFLGRITRYLVEEGMTQFVVIGSGLPNRRNVPPGGPGDRARHARGLRLQRPGGALPRPRHAGHQPSHRRRRG
ncbi:hypothetical protein GCM10018952_47790 [Streptosporangium vulgare]